MHLTQPALTPGEYTRPVREWPDDETAPRTACPKCGAGFAARAVHPVHGAPTGRDACPVCRAPLPVPDALHETYVQWFGLVNMFTNKSVGRGADYETAYDLFHDAYRVALLRWVPGRARFSTFAVRHLRGAQQNLPRAHQTNFENNVARIGGSDADERHEFAAVAPEPDGDRAEQSAAVRAAVESALAGLPRRAANMFRRRHGLPPYREPQTLLQIGRAYRLTRERVRQILVPVTETVKRRLSDEGFD